MQPLLNLVIDVGNTRIKAATFLATRLVEKQSFDSLQQASEFLTKSQYENIILSSVSGSSPDLLDGLHAKNKKLTASVNLLLPLTISYTTPGTLGIDRLAAVCGAIEMLPYQDTLVIDAGSCINYEFVDNHNVYHGGAISPGIQMRFKAMHTFTGLLPLVGPEKDVNLIGNSTESCLQSGVMFGVFSEVDGIIDRYKRKYPGMNVILCGGDSILFENKLKHSIFAAPDLVMRGLNRILLHNV